MSEKKTEKYGIPEDLKVERRPYTMSDKALAARRDNAQKSTGPTSEDGKKASSRNSWKHGLYAESFIFGKLGKPCQKTCSQYPCSLVEDNEVHPGETCLDKQHVAEAFDAIIKSMQSSDHGDFQSMAALEMAGAIDVLRKMKEAIIEDGVVVKSAKLDKDGKVIGYEYKSHPSLPAYMKLLESFNFTPGDFLMTPKEIAKAKKDDDEGKKETLTDVLAKSIENLSKAKGE